jgi:hypothetical protein
MVCQTYCHEDGSREISFASSFGLRRKLSLLNMSACRAQCVAQEDDEVELELSKGAKGPQVFTDYQGQIFARYSREGIRLFS